jgi:hypothetical protein
MTRRGAFVPFLVILGPSILLLASLAEPPTEGISFTEHLLKDGYGYAFGVVAADLDKDGKLDLTSVDTVGNALYWFANDGTGKFTVHVIAKDEPGWLERHAVGDVNGDGHLDVVAVKNLARELVWFENPGKPRMGGPWKKHVLAQNFYRAYDVALADFNGDGRLDVAASSFVGNELAWFENPGIHDGRAWTKHLLDSKIGETRTVRVADFNGDGKPDILGTAVLGNLVAWYENPGKANAPWVKHVIDDRTPYPVHGQPVDLDGDGDVDVVMALGMHRAPGSKETNQVVWYENVGKPGKGTQWKKHVIGELPFAFEAVAADLNGDGKPDVVATAWGPQGKLVWFENPGDPRQTPWKMHVLKDKWVNANQVIVADLDGDARPDIIACAERGSNDVRWWRNEGKKKR